MRVGDRGVRVGVTGGGGGDSARRAARERQKPLLEPCFYSIISLPWSKTHAQEGVQALSPPPSLLSVGSRAAAPPGPKLSGRASDVVGGAGISCRARAVRPRVNKNVTLAQGKNEMRVFLFFFFFALYSKTERGAASSPVSKWSARRLVYVK